MVATVNAALTRPLPWPARRRVDYRRANGLEGASACIAHQISFVLHIVDVRTVVGVLQKQQSIVSLATAAMMSNNVTMNE